MARQACALALVLATQFALAKDDCPGSIAAVPDDKFTDRQLPIFRTVYADLGCQLRIDMLPGRRGIRSFNQGDVDGELFRLQIAELHYSREFIRSAIPLVSVDSVLWHHPNINEPGKQGAIGYMRGIVWQENFVKGLQAVAFDSVNSMLATYQKGRLAGFLATNVSIRDLIKAGAVSPQPVRAQVISRAPIYHYLGAEYTPFMRRFSKYLAENNPFAK